MVGWVSFSLMQIYSHIGEVEDGMNTLAPPHSLVDASNSKSLNVTTGLVEFKNASFSYGRDVGGINDVNLTIRPGEKLGIVGASGAGKSTLVSLLLRMHDTEQGDVLVDGQNVSLIKQKSLRQAIGVVTQETAMFNRSAMDNILYGQPDASEGDVIAAAKRAQAHEFILDLKDFRSREGYDAFLGERGVKVRSTSTASPLLNTPGSAHTMPRCTPDSLASGTDSAVL